MAKSKDLFDSILPKLEESKPQQVKPPKPRKRKSKVSKPNALASGISTTPSSKRKSASSRLGGAKKSKLSPEQLRTIRSNAAKKAAQTRKQRELADPEYARRMREIRIENLRKARETMKRKMQDPEYRKRMEEVWKERARKSAETRKRKAEQDKEYAKRQRETRLKNLEKARKAQQEKKKVSTETPIITDKIKEYIPEPELEYEPNLEPEDYPIEYESDEILDERELMLEFLKGKVQMRADFEVLLQQLWEDEVDLYGEEPTLIRIKQEIAENYNLLQECVDIILYGSDQQEIENSMYTLVKLISGEVTPYCAEMIEMMANEIVPSYYKKRQHK